VKLPREFIRLPLRFDAQRLAEEVHAMPREAWQAHPLGYAGNSAVPLISVGGENNDYFAGAMAETAWLRQSPYLRQVLASFRVVFGRSRLMGLAGGSEVPRHCDTNYHWFTRVRIHVPIITFPDVSFHGQEQVVHMAAGESWIFDNWRAHHVVNPTPHLRVHLVADTVGSSDFWAMARLVTEAEDAGESPPQREIGYDEGFTPSLQMEQVNHVDVMHPGEMELLTEDLVEDLLAAGAQNPPEDARRFIEAVRGFYQDWKQLWTLHGFAESGWDDYEQLRNRLLQELYALRQPLKLASNGRVAQKCMLARVLVACVHRPLPGMNEIQFGS
jgi:hypothetical protein